MKKELKKRKKVVVLQRNNYYIVYQRLTFKKVLIRLIDWIVSYNER